MAYVFNGIMFPALNKRVIQIFYQDIAQYK